MRSRLTGTAIATLAVISALALSGGPASAATTSAAVSGGAQAQAATTPEECRSIRDTIAGLQSLKRIAQEELRYASPSQKSDLIAEIRSLTAEIVELNAQLVGCPA